MKRRRKILSGLLTMAMVFSLLPSTVFADTYTGGSYSGTAQVSPDEYGDFDAYDLSIDLDVDAAGTVTGLSVTSDVARKNKSYVADALDSYTSQVVGKSVDEVSTMSFDTVSEATCASYAFGNAIRTAASSAASTKVAAADTTALQAAIDTANAAKAPAEEAYTADSLKAYKEAWAAAIAKAQAVLDKAGATQAEVDAAVTTLSTELEAAKALLVEKDAIYVTMNIPYSDFYAAEGTTEYVDIVTTATGSKFKGTDGLAKGTYNDGTSILGVTYPVKMSAATYAELKEANDQADSSASYYFTILDEEPTAYKELTYADGSYSFSAATGSTGDASGISVSDATATSYGNYQVDLEGVLTTGGVTINGETQTIGGMIFETSAGNFGFACLENYWLGTRVTDVEVAFSAEGAPQLYNHGGAAFRQFSGLNGATINGVKIITDKGIYNVSCNVALKPYYTGTVKGVQTGDSQVTLKGLPSDLENGKVTISYSYTEEGKMRPTTVKVADAVEVGNGTITTTEAIDAEKTYTITVESDNYSPITATLSMLDQDYYYVTMNIPYSVYYGAEGVSQYLDVVSTATSSKFKGTTGLAKGTYNDGTSIKGVTAPVKLTKDLYLKLLQENLTENDDYYFTDLDEEPAVCSELTEAEDGNYNFTAAAGAEGDASSISVSEAYSSSYGNYQFDLEGVLTAGGVTINGEEQTISGLVMTTDTGETYGLACLENFWLGTRVPNVEVAFSAEGAPQLSNHGGAAFHQYAGLNGATVTNVKIITDKGIYNVACDVTLKPYYEGEIEAYQTGDQEVTLKGLPELENATATITYSYKEEGAFRPTTVTVADAAEIVNGAVATTEVLNPEYTYTVTVNSDTYSPMTTTVTVLDQDYYYVTMNVPYDDYYAAEGLTEYVDIVTTATGSKFKGITGLAKGTYNDGTSILGVTTPVKVDKATYASLLTLNLTENDDYYFTDLDEEPAVYKELTFAEDGSYSFSAATGAEGDASSISVSDATATSYGNYQVDLEGVLTAGGVTINGEEQTISGMIFETSAGNYGMACLENYWLGTRVTDVEVAFSAEGAPQLYNHGGAAFRQFSGLNGATINGVKIITDKGIYNVSCDVALKPYYTGTVKGVQTGDSQITLKGLPSNLENGKVTVSYSYTEEGQRRPTTVNVADAVEVGNGTIATTEALDAEKTYTITIESDNYSPITASLSMLDQDYYYVTMNIPYSVYYGAEGVDQYLDVVSTATGNKFKGTTGLAKGTYNDGTSIMGVTAPVKLDKDTYMKLLEENLTENDDYYFTDLDEEPAVYSELTVAEDGTYNFTAADGVAGDASSISVSEAYSSSYGNYQFDLEGVLTAGGVTINGEEQTISGLVMTTADGTTYGLACLENFWLGTRIPNVEVAFSAEGAPQLTNHGGAAFHQYPGLNGATVTNVKIITDKGIYNVACDVTLKPYYEGEIEAYQTGDQEVTLKGLPEMENATATITYSYKEEGAMRPTTVTVADAAEIVDGSVATTEVLNPEYTYTVTVNSDTYSPMTATVTVLDQDYYYVTMNVPYDDYYAAEGLTEYVDIVTTATGSKFKGITGLAKGTYNDGTSILGVTTPVKVDKATYAMLLALDLTENDDYYFTDLDEEPAVYKELTFAEDGSYSFSAATGAEGDASSISVSDASATSYGNYQVDLEGVLTAGGVTINGEEQTISGMIFETSAGNYGFACLENYWLGTRVTDVEVAFSAEGAPQLYNHGGAAFRQFSGLNGATINGVKIITDKGIYNVSCDVALKPYYDGTVSAFQTDAQEVSLYNLPTDLENGKVTISYSYTEEGQRRPTTVTVADAVDAGNGVIATTEALNLDYTYTVTVESDNYGPMTATVVLADQEAYYVTMNIPYAEYYAAEGVGEYLDVVTTATDNKFKGTTGLAKGTYNDGTSILGVTAPVKMDYETLVKVLHNGTTESQSHYCTLLTEEPAVYKTLTIAEDGTYSFSAAEGAVGDASSISVSAASTTSSYGNYQVDLEGVATAGGVTINGEEQTISGMIFTTATGNTYGMACLENFWLGTRVENVEVAWSAQGAPQLYNHGGQAFHQFSNMNGATLTNVKIITDKGIYYVDCNTALMPYYTGELTATADNNAQVSVTGLPADIQNPKMSVYYKVGSGRASQTTYAAENVDMTAGVAAMTAALTAGKDYTVVVSSDNYAAITAKNTVTGTATATISADGKSLQIGNLSSDITDPTVNLTDTNGKVVGEKLAVKNGTVDISGLKLDGGAVYAVTVNNGDQSIAAQSVTVPVTITSATIVKGATDDVLLVCNKADSGFLGVTVDGAALTSSDYSEKSGSTNVTLKGSYASKLDTGVHNVVFLYKDQDVPTTVTVTAKSSDSSDKSSSGSSSSGSSSSGTSSSGTSSSGTSSSGSSSSSSSAKTGDTSHAAVWAVIMLCAAAAIITVIVRRRKLAK